MRGRLKTNVRPRAPSFMLPPDLQGKRVWCLGLLQRWLITPEHTPWGLDGPPRTRQHPGLAAETAEHAFSIADRYFAVALRSPRPCSEKTASRKVPQLSSPRSGSVENLPVLVRFKSCLFLASTIANRLADQISRCVRTRLLCCGYALPSFTVAQCVKVHRNNV